jgi:uncharacterized protein (DUF111 family)
VPAPATLQLLQDSSAPIARSNFDFECLTPTGAAILTSIAAGYGGTPVMDKITNIGYGSGTKNPADHPNIVRLILGVASESNPSWNTEMVAVVETNLDDISPQLISFCTQQLFDAGALDVIVLPATMKKGRSGHLLQVVCVPSDKSRMEDIIIEQTSALGVRSHFCERSICNRDWHEVQMDLGDLIRIKIGRDQSGNISNAQPEFEDCAAYAAKHQLPLKIVMQEAISKFKQTDH